MRDRTESDEGGGGPGWPDLDMCESEMSIIISCCFQSDTQHTRQHAGNERAREEKSRRY